jgi:hypothetical protein
MSGDAFQAFLAWMRQRGFVWSEEDVQFREVGGTHAVLARRELPACHTVCLMPKSEMLTIRTCSIADLLQQHQARTVLLLAQSCALLTLGDASTGGSRRLCWLGSGAHARTQLEGEVTARGALPRRLLTCTSPC